MDQICIKSKFLALWDSDIVAFMSKEVAGRPYQHGMGAPPQSICAASKCVVRSVWLGYLPTWKPLSHTCHPPSTSLTLDSRLCTSFSLEPQLSALRHQRRTLQAALWLGQGFSWLPSVAPRESHGDWSCSLRASELSFTPCASVPWGACNPGPMPQSQDRVLDHSQVLPRAVTA